MTSQREYCQKSPKSVWPPTLVSQRMMRINLIAYLRREAIMKLSSMARENGFTPGFTMTKVSLGHGVPHITYGRIFIRYTDKWIADHPDDFEEVRH